MSNSPSWKGDASLHLQIINHVPDNMNALEALSLNVPIKEFMLNNLVLASLEPETQQEW